jgi:hypothetical protein
MASAGCRPQASGLRASATWQLADPPRPSCSLARGGAAAAKPAPAPQRARARTAQHIRIGTFPFRLSSSVQDYCGCDWPSGPSSGPKPPTCHNTCLSSFAPRQRPLCARRRSGPDADPHLTAFPQDALLRKLPNATAWRSAGIARTSLTGTPAHKNTTHHLRYPKPGSPRTANPDNPCRALHTHSPNTSTRSSPERRPWHLISRSSHCPLFSNNFLDRPSCSSQNISLFALWGYLF